MCTKNWIGRKTNFCSCRWIIFSPLNNSVCCILLNTVVSLPTSYRTQLHIEGSTISTWKEYSFFMSHILSLMMFNPVKEWKEESSSLQFDREQRQEKRVREMNWGTTFVSSLHPRLSSQSLLSFLESLSPLGSKFFLSSFSYDNEKLQSTTILQKLVVIDIHSVSLVQRCAWLVYNFEEKKRRKEKKFLDDIFDKVLVCSETIVWNQWYNILSLLFCPCSYSILAPDVTINLFLSRILDRIVSFLVFPPLVRYIVVCYSSLYHVSHSPSLTTLNESVT